MKKENLDKLVEYVHKYMITGDYMWHPRNTQYSFYTNILVDELSTDKYPIFDSFDDQLVSQIKQQYNLDVTPAIYGQAPDEMQKRYEIFYYTWASWDVLYDALHRNKII